MDRLDFKWLIVDSHVSHYLPTPEWGPLLCLGVDAPLPTPASKRWIWKDVGHSSPGCPCDPLPHGKGWLIPGVLLEDRPKSQPEARAGNPFLQAEWVTRNLTLELTTVHILQRQMPGCPGHPCWRGEAGNGGDHVQGWVRRKGLPGGTMNGRGRGGRILKGGGAAKPEPPQPGGRRERKESPGGSGGWSRIPGSSCRDAAFAG